MDWLIGVGWWSKALSPETPLLELFVRGSCMYLGVLVLLRALLRREAGMVAVPDILLIVLIADAAQNGMADDYRSITDGLILVGVLVFWNLVIDRLTYHFPAIERLVHPPPLPLVRDGKLLRGNLRKEFVSNEELWSQLRAQGVEELAQIKAAYMEADGSVTVIRHGPDEAGRNRRRRAG